MKLSQLCIGIYVVLSMLSKRSSESTKVKNCNVVGRKGFNSELAVKINHYYEEEEDCWWSFLVKLCNDPIKHGIHDKNEICVESALRSLTTADCAEIRAINSDLLGCEEWTCSGGLCCFRVSYAPTYTTYKLIKVPGFTFLFSNTYTSNAKSSHSSQDYRGISCTSFFAPYSSGITNLSYAAIPNIVFADSNITLEFDLDVIVPTPAYYEFAFPFSSQLSIFADSCDFNLDSMGICSHSSNTILFTSSIDIQVGSHRFIFYHLRNPESNYSNTVSINLTSSINNRQFPLTASISRPFNPITDVGTHLGVKENQPLNMGEYIFTFNFFPLPLRQNRILRFHFPSKFDISAFTLVGNSFEVDSQSAQDIYLKLLDTEFMDGDIELQNIKNPAVSATGYVYQLKIYTYIRIGGILYGSHRSVSDDTLKFHLRGSLNSTSSITVIGNVELEKNSVYKFVLHPSPNFILGTDIHLEFPSVLELDSSCSANISDSSCSTYTTTQNLIKIENGLNSSATQTAITFEVKLIRNPVLPILVSDLSVNVRTKEPNEWWYHETNINISLPEYYDPHPLDELNVRASEYTVTNTTYTFNLRNLDYMIPPGAQIRLKFPPTLLFITSTPIVDDLNNLHTSTTGLFEYPNLTISEGFGVMLIPDSEMQFRVGNILNPYFMGNTDSFQMIIYINSDTYLKLFEMKIDLNKSITEVAQFPSFSLESASNTTNTWTNFTFDFEVGDGELNSSHLIKFQTAKDIQLCDKDTIIPTLGIPGIGSTIYEGSYYTTRTNYSFEINSVISPHTICQFKVECRNPYTTRPSGIFSLWATDGTNEFYNQTAGIPDMTDMNNYSAFNFTMENMYPREIITYSFNFTATSPLSTKTIDQIEITVPEEVEIEGCMPSDVIGIYIADALNCTIVDQIITIYNITQLESLFSFNMDQLRNPSRSEYEIYFTSITKHSDGHWGENMTTNIVQILCNFPCKTCLTNSPNQCTTCFSNNNEVFQFSGVNRYLLHEDVNLCVDICPTFTYMRTPIICKNCSITCATCYNGSNEGCETCIPGFLMIIATQECWENCPPGTFYNDIQLFCQKCDFRCLNCRGPSNTDCESCSKGNNIIPDHIVKSCICVEGTSPLYYPDIDIYQCDRCNMNCGSCTDPELCLTCRDKIMIYDEFTKICTCPPHFYSKNGICMPCHDCCLNCFGPLSSNCRVGECNTEDSCYPVSNEPSNCVRNCNSNIIPLYFDPTSEDCHNCHSDCLICSGPQANNCFACTHPKLLTNKKECLYSDCKLYPESIQLETECAECHPPCEDCVDFPTKCLACQFPLFLLPATYSCFLACPSGYYPILNSRICKKCPPNCELCTGRGINEADCNYCTHNYFFNSTNSCVLGKDCEVNSYANIDLRICSVCNQACIGCSGAGNANCKACSKKFLMEEKGVCEKITCGSKEYLNDDAKCIKCHSRCESCSGGNEFECIKCGPGFVMNIKSNKCETCEEVNEGYGNPLVGSGEYDCLEICGDSKNMGILECDDGNLLGGDGCSPQCALEEGFKCKGGNSTTKDTCVETAPPYVLSFVLLDLNNIQIVFSEPLLFTDQNPENAIQFFISGVALNYPFEIENLTVDTKTPIIQLQFEVTFLATLFGSEEMSMSIKNKSLITDLAGNNILNRTLSIVLNEFEYISEEDKKVAEKTGTSTQATLITTLVMALLMCLIFNTPLEGLWGLINVLQLISYTMLIPLFFPKNLLMLLENIALVHGFNKFIPNLFKYIFTQDDRQREPFNHTFKKRGFNNRTMILLAGSEITAYCFIIIGIGILILVKRKAKKLRPIAIVLLKKFKYSVLIRSVITSYLKLALASFVNFAVMAYDSYNSVCALLFCVLFVSFVALFPAYLSEFLFQHYGDAQTSDEFQHKFDSLIKEFDIKKGANKMHFYPIFLLRRSIFAAILVFLQTSPLAQLILINILTFITIVWMLKTIPFRDKLICSSHILSEIGFLCYTSSLFPFLSEEMDSKDRLYIGSIIVWSLVSLMAIIWLIFLCHLFILFINHRKLKKAQKVLEEEETRQALQKAYIEKEKTELREKGKRFREKLNRCRKPKIVVWTIFNIYIIYRKQIDQQIFQ